MRIFFHTSSWNCVNQVLELQRNISSAVFHLLLWLVLKLVSPQSLLCSFPNNYHTNHFIWNVVFSDMIFLQYSGNINPVSAEKRGCQLFPLHKGAIITFEQLRDAFCPLRNIDGKTLIFAEVQFFRSVLECLFLD